MPTANGSTARTGLNAKVVIDDTLMYRMTSFSINPKTSETAWGDSDSGGFTNRSAARKEMTGSVSGKYDEDRPPHQLCMPGDIIDLATGILFKRKLSYSKLSLPFE